MQEGMLTFVLPSSYTYASIVDDTNSFNPPMFGKIEGNSGTLRHLASFFKITVSNIPAGGDDMKLIFTADKRITGSFTADPSAETPVINTDNSAGNTVTIYFSNTVSGNTGTFYIPAPLGTYASITAEIIEGDISIGTKTWTDHVVKRMTPKRGFVELEYIATINEIPFGSGQECHIGSEWKDLIPDCNIGFGVSPYGCKERRHTYHQERYTYLCCNNS